MHWRHTGWLILAAGFLALFIVAFERPARLARREAAAVPRLLPELDPATVVSLEIRSASNGIVLVRTNDSWEIVGQLRRPAQAGLVEALLARLAGLRGRSILSTSELRNRPHAAAEFGLNPPSRTIAIGNRSGRVEVLLGSRSIQGDHVFFQVTGVPGIFVAQGDLEDQVPADSDGWRDPTLVPIDRIPFDRVRVASPSGAFTLVRNPTNAVWQMTEPRAARADSQRVGLLLRQLALTQVIRFLAPTSAPPPEAAGLQPARLRLSLGRGTNDLFQLALGAAITNAPAVYAQRSGEPELLAVPTEVQDLLRISYKDLLDRRILRFEPDAVQEIEIVGRESFRAARDAAGWRLLPADVRADSELVNLLLGRLATLEIVDLAKEVVTVLDLANYGLAPPVLRVTLRATPGTTNTTVAELETGALRENRVFARVPAEAPVYALDPSDVDELPTEDWQLRDRRLWRFDPTTVSALTVRHEGLEWSVRRLGTNEWVAPPGWRASINPFALDEALHRLSQARAITLLGPGDARAQSLGVNAGPQIQVEYRLTPPAPPLRLAFGKRSPAGNRYGALTAPDGTRLVFELPGPVFDDLWREIGLAESPPPSAR